MTINFSPEGAIILSNKMGISGEAKLELECFVFLLFLQALRSDNSCLLGKGYWLGGPRLGEIHVPELRVGRAGTCCRRRWTSVVLMTVKYSGSFSLSDVTAICFSTAVFSCESTHGTDLVKVADVTEGDGNLPLFALEENGGLRNIQ